MIGPSRAALVLGFGYGRANEDVATLVAERHASHPFDWIVAQQAALGELSRRKVPVSPMHRHVDDLHVDTMEAIGLGVMKLSRLSPRARDRVELELIAHECQLLRAHRTASLVLGWLASSSKPPLQLFVGRVTLCPLIAVPRMRMNLPWQSWRQPWTTLRLLAAVFGYLGERRDLHRRRRIYDRHPVAFLHYLSGLERRLARARVPS